MSGGSEVRQQSSMLILLLLISLCMLSGMGLASEATKVISGTGFGELLLNFTIQDTTPTFLGSYSYDIVGINILLISPENWRVTSSELGYALNYPGIFIPARPNNLTVTARGIKNLNIGLKKDPENGIIGKGRINTTRMWISTRAIADMNGMATISSEKLSPGIYHAKIFGDAAENVSQVNLTMTLVKKMIVNGKFNLSINTTGFPSGTYSIAVKALNGSLNLDEIAVGSVSLGD